MAGSVLRWVLVASGALCALLAMLAVFDQAWELVYAWLGFGLVAQTTLQSRWYRNQRIIGLTAAIIPADGSLESSQDIAHTQAMQDADDDRSAGAIAFLLKVFVPVVVILHAGFLDGGTGNVIAGLVVLAGTYRLALPSWAKSVRYFQGLPALWGLLGLYLHAFDATPTAAALVIVATVVMTFVPIAWPHPWRSPVAPHLTRVVATVWGVALAWVVWHGFPAGFRGKAVLLAALAYWIGLAVLMARRGYLGELSLRSGKRQATSPSAAFLSTSDEADRDGN